MKRKSRKEIVNDKYKIVLGTTQHTEEETKRESSNQQWNQPVPLLSIDVNFGEDLDDKIEIYSGDNLKQLSEEFSIKHNLTPAMKKKLMNMLEVQVDNLNE